MRWTSTSDAPWDRGVTRGALRRGASFFPCCWCFEFFFFLQFVSSFFPHWATRKRSQTETNATFDAPRKAIIGQVPCSLALAGVGGPVRVRAVRLDVSRSHAAASPTWLTETQFVHRVSMAPLVTLPVVKGTSRPATDLHLAANSAVGSAAAAVGVVVMVRLSAKKSSAQRFLPL